MTDDETRALLSMVSRLVEHVGNCEALLVQLVQSTQLDPAVVGGVIAEAQRIVDEQRNPNAPAPVLSLARDDDGGDAG